MRRGSHSPIFAEGIHDDLGLPLASWALEHPPVRLLGHWPPPGQVSFHYVSMRTHSFQGTWPGILKSPHSIPCHLNPVATVLLPTNLKSQQTQELPVSLMEPAYLQSQT